MLTIQQRLNKLDLELRKPQLIENRGIGNEIGFYIFDYDPEHEPVVQEFLPTLKVNLKRIGFKVTEFNLYQIILNILEERQLLQKAFELESKQGSLGLERSIRPLVRPEQAIAYMQKQIQNDEDLIFITGVGESYPLMRSHLILNNLHSVLDRKPLVMFFPGAYDGQELKLFNAFRDDNYYRAFSIVGRS
ncbi:protein of unknown function (DUF1788) [Synechococcus sp. PCC 7502]|uniref:DUF1788 domain-containing protein n=1 Tax=Synechococcus sp. PCC 7502 TaxID=1173263 RepID=UPI00029FE0E8|nr:DUF1788 domain-containing protein [Synechococcus sp. PCC 7502]AFY73452.1 protein of unknown function (DUF1788) [Synechococcus sp. PCC 7502]